MGKESISTTSITVGIMERHQTGQDKQLMEVMVERGGLDVVHRPGGSLADRRSCFKCVVALASAMGLVIVALVACFVLHIFMIMPSTNQDDPQLYNTSKVNIACEIKPSDEAKQYDIFTVERSAKYIILGLVELSNNVAEDSVRLTHTFKDDSHDIQKKKVDNLIVFRAEILLVEGSRISLYIHSAHTYSWLHVYEV